MAEKSWNLHTVWPENLQWAICVAEPYSHDHYYITPNLPNANLEANNFTKFFSYFLDHIFFFFAKTVNHDFFLFLLISFFPLQNFHEFFSCFPNFDDYFFSVKDFFFFSVRQHFHDFFFNALQNLCVISRNFLCFSNSNYENMVVVLDVVWEGWRWIIIPLLPPFLFKNYVKSISIKSKFPIFPHCYMAFGQGIEILGYNKSNIFALNWLITTCICQSWNVNVVNL